MMTPAARAKLACESGNVSNMIVMRLLSGIWLFISRHDRLAFDKPSKVESRASKLTLRAILCK
eukprot:6211213-Pleurochrysis_carterae.AAC.1